MAFLYFLFKRLGKGHVQFLMCYIFLIMPWFIDYWQLLWTFLFSPSLWLLTFINYVLLHKAIIQFITRRWITSRFFLLKKFQSKEILWKLLTLYIFQESRLKPSTQIASRSDLQPLPYWFFCSWHWRLMFFNSEVSLKKNQDIGGKKCSFFVL